MSGVSPHIVVCSNSDTEIDSSLLVAARMQNFPLFARDLEKWSMRPDSLFRSLGKVKDRSLWTAIHWLALNDRLGVVFCDLLKISPPAGVSKKSLWEPILSSQTDEGQTPLHILAIHNNAPSVVAEIIDLYPHALLMVDHHSRRPLTLSSQHYQQRSNEDAILELFAGRTYKQETFPKNQLTLKLCMSRLKKEGLTATVEAAVINDLSPAHFVFKVLDLFLNTMRHELAEYIVSCVGAASVSPRPPERHAKKKAKQGSRHPSSSS
jgi:hypothetical protein